MTRTRRVAHSVISAGLGAMLAFGNALPAFAESSGGQTSWPVGEYASPDYAQDTSPAAESTGDTNLYVTAQRTDLTSAEGLAGSQVKVTIPVAIHYVADAEGNLTGPSDNTVKFVNHAKVGPVHISKIAVESRNDATIVADAQNLSNDQMRFFMKPVQGQSNAEGTSFRQGLADEGKGGDFLANGSVDELGEYTGQNGSQPTNKNDWNIAQKHGALALNNLTGRIGGFKKINPSTDYQVGVIHWTVRPGVRAAADERDSRVTIRFNPNNGFVTDGGSIANQTVPVLNANVLPDIVPVTNALSTPLTATGQELTPPAGYVDNEGNEVTYEFDHWDTQPDGEGTAVSTLANFGKSEAELAGTVQEVYAIYVPVTVSGEEPQG